MTAHRIYPYLDQNHNRRAQCACGQRFTSTREAAEHAAEHPAPTDPRDGHPVPHWTPYADGTSGQQGDTSRDAEPWRSQRIPLVYQIVADARTHGITSREAEARLNLGHGTVSGALSNLHRIGAITRLRERRDRYGVYVLPEHTDGRDTVDHRSNQPRRGCTCPCPNHPTEQDTVTTDPHQPADIITPDTARAWLASTTTRRASALRYAEALRDGRWTLSPDYTTEQDHQ